MERLNDRQKQITAAALGIISERGLEALTMKAIAQRVGFSDAAVYRHFRDKSGMLSAMVDGFAADSLHALERIGRGGGSGLETIRGFFLDRCRAFAVDRALAIVLFAEDLFKSDPVLAARIHGVMRDHRRLLLRAIRLGQRQGLLAPLPAAHLFTVIMGSLRLLVLQWLVGGCGLDLPRAGEKLWRSLATLLAIKPRRSS
ncbi:MAG: TetR/AcrR family transcriptional regulator [Candidatus Aminicenantes bacterium]|nr:TetR/AcrR family transcriptional regulator [Candidatus Aminicenantes bacterium]